MTTLPKLLGLVGSDWATLCALVPVFLLALLDIGLVSIVAGMARRITLLAGQVADLSRVVAALRRRGDR